MKRRMNDFAYPACVGALVGIMLARPESCALAALSALTSWASAVVPSLFPMLACALMLSGGGGGKTPACVALSFLTGSPGGARLLAARKPGGKRALRLAAMTGVMSPGFLLGTASAWLGEARAGPAMLLSHWAAAIIIGICTGRGGDGGMDTATRTRVSPGEALSMAASAMLPIAGYMALANIAGVALSWLMSGAPLAAALCLCEVTSGVKMLSELPLSLAARASLVCAACSLGGLSLLAQNAAYLTPLGVKPSRLVALRFSHAALSLPLCYALCLAQKL